MGTVSKAFCTAITTLLLCQTAIANETRPECSRMLVPDSLRVKERVLELSALLNQLSKPQPGQLQSSLRALKLFAEKEKAALLAAGVTVSEIENAQKANALISIEQAKAEAQRVAEQKATLSKELINSLRSSALFTLDDVPRSDAGDYFFAARSFINPQKQEQIAIISSLLREKKVYLRIYSNSQGGNLVQQTELTLPFTLGGGSKSFLMSNDLNTIVMLEEFNANAQLARLVNGVYTVSDTAVKDFHFPFARDSAPAVLTEDGSTLLYLSCPATTQLRIKNLNVPEEPEKFVSLAEASGPSSQTKLRLSPDQKHVVYFNTATKGLLLVSLDELSAKSLQYHANPTLFYDAVWTPDSQSLIVSLAKRYDPVNSNDFGFYLQRYSVKDRTPQGRPRAEYDHPPQSMTLSDDGAYLYVSNSLAGEGIRIESYDMSNNKAAVLIHSDHKGAISSLQPLPWHELLAPMADGSVSKFRLHISLE